MKEIEDLMETRKKVEEEKANEKRSKQQEIQSKIEK